MRALIDALKPFRRLEIIIAFALICVLAIIMLNGTPADSGGMTDAERRMCAVLSDIDGAGRVRVMIAEDANGKCTGVLVVADGARDLKTYLTIQRAVRALTGIDAERIEIVKGEAG